jgi:hypothetical protein
MSGTEQTRSVRIPKMSFWGSSSADEAVSVTQYLERARECANLADRMSGEDKKKLLEIADAWIKMATVEAAKATAKPAAQLQDGKVQ